LAGARVAVNHYYFYVDDEEFGPGFRKVCSYAPWAIKVCLNGHQWVKQQLEQRIVYEALDNVRTRPRTRRRQRLVRAGGEMLELPSIAGCEVAPGDRLILETPGGAVGGRRGRRRHRRHRRPIPAAAVTKSNKAIPPLPEPTARVSPGARRMRFPTCGDEFDIPRSTSKSSRSDQENDVKKNQKKLALHRDTLRKLAGPVLREAAAAKITAPFCTVTVTEFCSGSCLTRCGCPTGGNCTDLC